MKLGRSFPDDRLWFFSASCVVFPSGEETKADSRGLKSILMRPCPLVTKCIMEVDCAPVKKGTECILNRSPWATRSWRYDGPVTTNPKSGGIYLVESVAMCSPLLSSEKCSTFCITVVKRPCLFMDDTGRMSSMPLRSEGFHVIEGPEKCICYADAKSSRFCAWSWPPTAMIVMVVGAQKLVQTANRLRELAEKNGAQALPDLQMKNCISTELVR